MARSGAPRSGANSTEERAAEAVRTTNMLQHETEFPQVGSLGYLATTAEPARILQRNADGSILVERRQRAPGGGTSPLTGAAANRRVDAGDIFPDVDTAMFGSAEAASKARRSKAAGGR